MKVYFECTMRQSLSFFYSNSIFVFICTDLPRSLKTGQSFWSMLREVPNRVILLVLMRRKKDSLSNTYCQHVSKSWLWEGDTLWNTVYWIASRYFRIRDRPRILLKLTTGKFCQNLVSKMKLELRIKKKSMREQTSENRFTHYLIKCKDCFKHNGLGNNAIQIIFLLKESLNIV